MKANLICRVCRATNHICHICRCCPKCHCPTTPMDFVVKVNKYPR